MAQISPYPRHFYLPNFASWDALKALHERHARGGPADHRYTNRHAWESILHVYFPDHYDPPQLADAQPGQQTAKRIMYLVLRHFFDQAPTPPRDDDGYPAGHPTGEAITLERKTVDLPSRVPHRRDVLFVACSPPGSSDWTGAMRTAVAYLAQRHPTRSVYFILAVGVRWMEFYWDPEDPRPEGQGLRMRVTADEKSEGGGDEGEGEEGWYVVSPEVRAPPGVDGGHVDAEGVVRTDRARSLDCFTAAGPSVSRVGPSVGGSEMPRLAYQEDLDFLEEFLGVVARHEYVGEHECSLGWEWSA